MVFVALVGVPFATVSGAANSTSPQFYLDIGASESVGFQPTYVSPHGQLTSSGYANDVVNFEAARGVTLRLRELGCPGESPATAISGSDGCYHSRGSQLADAVSFLRHHRDQTGLVTIDLGFNQLSPCIHQEFTNPVCVSAQLANVRQDLTYIVNQLLSVAGPNVTFVGLNHNDPFLASAVNRSHDVIFALDSATAIDELNRTLSNVYGAFNIPVANVAGAFANSRDTLVPLSHVGTVPVDVARACTLTWMCHAAPYGPNLHPNDAGYSMMAAAIMSVLPPTRA